MLRIGTKNNKLAILKASKVKDEINILGHQAELYVLESNKLGIVDLEKALLELSANMFIHEIDDYSFNSDLIQTQSIGPRLNYKDALYKSQLEKTINEDEFHLGASSKLRRAQWKFKYPRSTFSDLSGSLPSRLERLWDSDWDGILASSADLQRLGFHSKACVELDWMIPNPNQGILGVSFLKNDNTALDVCNSMCIPEVQLCAEVERKFKTHLDNEDLFSVGAFARIMGETLYFKACIHDIDGISGFYINKNCPMSLALSQVQEWVEEIIGKGASNILEKKSEN